MTGFIQIIDKTVRRLGLDPTPKRGARIGEMVNVA